MRSAALWGLLLWGGLSSACGGHGNHDDKEWTKEELQELEEKWGFEVSMTQWWHLDAAWSHTPDTAPVLDFDANRLHLQWGFSGIGTFAHLEHVKCLTDPSVAYDIAIIGAPFDTAVSFRPGLSPAVTRHVTLCPSVDAIMNRGTDQVASRRPLRPQSHPPGLVAADGLPGVQPARQHEPVHELGQDHRLR